MTVSSSEMCRSQAVPPGGADRRTAREHDRSGESQRRLQLVRPCYHRESNSTPISRWKACVGLAWICRRHQSRSVVGVSHFRKRPSETPAKGSRRSVPGCGERAPPHARPAVFSIAAALHLSATSATTAGSLLQVLPTPCAHKDFTCVTFLDLFAPRTPSRFSLFSIALLYPKQRRQRDKSACGGKQS